MVFSFSQVQIVYKILGKPWKMFDVSYQLPYYLHQLFTSSFLTFSNTNRQSKLLKCKFVWIQSSVIYLLLDGYKSYNWMGVNQRTAPTLAIQFIINFLSFNMFTQDFYKLSTIAFLLTILWFLISQIPVNHWSVN